MPWGPTAQCGGAEGGRATAVEHAAADKSAAVIELDLSGGHAGAGLACSHRRGENHGLHSEERGGGGSGQRGGGRDLDHQHLGGQEKKNSEVPSAPVAVAVIHSPSPWRQQG